MFALLALCTFARWWFFEFPASDGERGRAETQLYYGLHRTTHGLTFCFGFGFLCYPVLSCLPCNVSTYGNNSETRERLATGMGLS